MVWLLPHVTTLSIFWSFMLVIGCTMLLVFVHPMATADSVGHMLDWLVLVLWQGEHEQGAASHTATYVRSATRLHHSSHGVPSYPGQAQ